LRLCNIIDFPAFIARNFSYHPRWFFHLWQLMSDVGFSRISMERFLMKRFLCAAALCAAGAANVALAADDTGAWYVSPMVQWTMLHHERPAEDDAGFQVGIGKNFAPNWAAEFNVSSGSFNGANRSRLKLSQYSVDLLRKFSFLPDSQIQPFLLAGLGGIDDKYTNVDRASTFAGEVGGGLLWAFGHQDGSHRLQLRTEAKYRKEFGKTGYGASDPGDVLFGVGLQWLWGAPTAAPVVAAAPPADSDHDGVTDDLDKCPGTPAGAKVDAVGCELDSDGDGVVDRLDQCPDTPKGTPVNATGCPLDSDGDGVMDSDDRCPNTPKGDRVDVHGCTFAGEIKLPGVTFNTDSAVLLSQSASVLDEAVATLKKYPELAVEVDGHTDNRGSAQHNQVLSQKRAESVAAYLKEHGVTNKLSAKGFGKTQPIADNKTDTGRLENRRVTLKVSSN
jgi:OmpA-OmpF porin, OOP family